MHYRFLTPKMNLFIYLSCFVVWLIDERHLALFPAGTIVRDPHDRESPTGREQHLNHKKLFSVHIL